MHFQWAKSAENRQLQNDAISSVFNSQSTSCTKNVGIFELRTKIENKISKSKIYSSKKIKNGVFFGKFRHFLKNPRKKFSLDP
jgi:hypothetical protein